MRERGRSDRAHAVLVTATVAITGVAGAVALVVIAWPTWVATTVLGQDERAVDVTTLRLARRGLGGDVGRPVADLLPHRPAPPRRRSPRSPAPSCWSSSPSASTPRRASPPSRSSCSPPAPSTLGLPAVQRVAPLTRAVPWSGATSAARSTPADIAMIVPFYNPGPDALVDTVRRLASHARRGRHELPGRRRVRRQHRRQRGGARRARRIAHVDVIVLPTNTGKGAALRAGLAALDDGPAPSLVGYIDADGDIPPRAGRRAGAHRRRQRGRRGGGQQAAPGLGARRAPPPLDDVGAVPQGHPPAVPPGRARHPDRAEAVPRRHAGGRSPRCCARTASPSTSRSSSPRGASAACRSSRRR